MDVETKHQYTLGVKVRFYITATALAAILTGLGAFMLSWSSHLLDKLRVDPSSVVNLHDITLSVLLIPAFLWFLQFILMFIFAAICIMSIHNGWEKGVDQPEAEGGTLVAAFLYLIVVPVGGIYVLGGILYLVGFPIYMLTHYTSVDWNSPGSIIPLLVWVMICPGMFPVLFYCEMLFETMFYWMDRIMWFCYTGRWIS